MKRVTCPYCHSEQIVPSKKWNRFNLMKWLFVFLRCRDCEERFVRMNSKLTIKSRSVQS